MALVSSTPTTPEGPVTPRYLPLEKAAAYLGWPLSTLRTYRCRGVAPPAIKVGNRVYFKVEDLDDFMKERAEPDQGGA